MGTCTLKNRRKVKAKQSTAKRWQSCQSTPKYCQSTAKGVAVVYVLQTKGVKCQVLPTAKGGVYTFLRDVFLLIIKDLHNRDYELPRGWQDLAVVGRS
jgi:hypothetical protein